VRVIPFAALPSVLLASLVRRIRITIATDHLIAARAQARITRDRLGRTA
jgi:type III secretory pathway component EscV